MNNFINQLSVYFADLTSSEWDWGLVGVNLLVITALLFIFKYKVAWLSGVSAKNEVAEKDNPAFGTVLGFSFLSFFLIMSAAATGSDSVPFLTELKLMGGYGIAGMFMLLISRVVGDKVSMGSFCLQEEIRKGNMAAAIVDSGNMLATALIVFTYMGWVKGASFEPIFIVAYGWLLSQVLLSFVSWLRGKMYKASDDSTLQSAIKSGNVAVAIRYTAYKLSFALTPLIAAVHYPFTSDDAWWSATAIFISSVLLAFAIKLIASVAKRIIIPGVDYADEINIQRNVGVAVIEACIVIGITYAAYGLLK